MQIHPLDLSEYGLQSNGQPLFRVILAQERTDTLVFEGRAFEVPRYPDVKGWVLEKHVDPVTYFGNVARAEYEKQADALAVKSEYYAEGDYESSRLLGEHVDPVIVRDWIERVLFQRDRLTEQERLAALTEKKQREEKQRVQQTDDIIDTALKG